MPPYSNTQHYYRTNEGHWPSIKVYTPVIYIQAVNAGTRASYMSQTISQTPLNIHTSIVIRMHLCKYTYNIRWPWHNANRIMLVKHATPAVVWLVAAQQQSVALTDCFLHKQKMVVATNQSSQLHDTHTASYIYPHACQQAHPHDSPCRYLLYMWMLQVHRQYYVIKH